MILPQVLKETKFFKLTNPNFCNVIPSINSNADKTKESHWCSSPLQEWEGRAGHSPSTWGSTAGNNSPRITPKNWPKLEWQQVIIVDCFSICLWWSWTEREQTRSLCTVNRGKDSSNNWRTFTQNPVALRKIYWNPDP